MLNYSIPKNLDSIPNSLRDEPSENKTNHAKWHSDNFYKAQVSSGKMKTKKYQSYINQQLQVHKYEGPTGTITPAGLANKSSKNQVDEVTKNDYKVKKIVNSINLKVFNERSTEACKNVSTEHNKPSSFQRMGDLGEDVTMEEDNQPQVDVPPAGSQTPAQQASDARNGTAPTQNDDFPTGQICSP